MKTLQGKPILHLRQESVSVTDAMVLKDGSQCLSGCIHTAKIISTVDPLEAKLSCFPMPCHCHAGCTPWADFTHFCHWVGRAVKCQFWKMRLSTDACITQLSREKQKWKYPLAIHCVLDNFCLCFQMHSLPSSWAWRNCSAHLLQGFLALWLLVELS